MASIEQANSRRMSSDRDPHNQSGLLSSESVLKILRLILAGAPLEKCSPSLRSWWSHAATERCAPSGFPAIMSGSCTARRLPVFPDSSRM
jgi:hypothetical protein